MQDRNRSTSPTIEQKPEATTADVVNVEEGHGRSASPIAQEKAARSRSPSLTIQSAQQRSRSPSVDTEEAQNHGQPLSPTTLQKTDNHSDQLRKANEELDRPVTPIAQETKQRSRSPSPNTEQAPEHGRTPSPLVEHQSEVITHGLTNTEGEFNRSLGTEKAKERSRPASPIGELKAETTASKEDERGERKASIPSVSPHTDDLLAEKRDFEHITEEKQQSLSAAATDRRDSIPEAEVQQRSSHALTSSATPRRVLPGQHASLDQSQSNRRPSLTRSRSQTAVIRPTTLPFTPNNHDLDGLYMSSPADDGEEENDYYRKSAPSTATIEHRRSSLFQDYSPVNPVEISKRLSIVEKSRAEGIRYRFNPGDLLMVLDGHLPSPPPPPPSFFIICREIAMLSFRVRDDRYQCVSLLDAEAAGADPAPVNDATK